MSSSNRELSKEIADLENNLEKRKADIVNNLTTWDRVLLARHSARPYCLDYIEKIFENFVELKGDRCFGNDEAIVTGFAKLNNDKVVVIGHQKGRDISNRNKRNFGMPHPEGYRKVLRILRLASKFNLPIITMIDTPGAFPGLGSEERHIGEAIAVNLREFFTIKSPIISIIIGEGGSGGALGIGIANAVLMLKNSYYSVISPEGCASILWDDESKVAEAAEEMKINAEQLKKLNIIDEIIDEPFGGAHKNYDETCQNMKKSIVQNLNKFKKFSTKALLDHRYSRFRKFGT